MPCWLESAGAVPLAHRDRVKGFHLGLLFILQTVRRIFCRDGKEQKGNVAGSERG